MLKLVAEGKHCRAQALSNKPSRVMQLAVVAEVRIPGFIYFLVPPISKMPTEPYSRPGRFLAEGRHKDVLNRTVYDLMISSLHQ